MRTTHAVGVLCVALCSGVSSAEPQVLYRANECGQNVLLLVARLYGYDAIDQSTVRALLPDASAEGNTMAELFDAAKALGFNPEGIRTSLESLASRRRPALVRLDGKHFVLFAGVTEEGVLISDPPLGNKFLTSDEFLKRWDGAALVLAPTPHEQAVIAKGDSAASSIAGSSGVLQFDAYDHDFGQVKAGEKPTWEVSFVNRSERAASISRIAKSCGCATIDLVDSKKRFEPGERGSLLVKYDSTGLAGSTGQTVSVFNDQNPNAADVIKLKIQVIRDVSVQPSFVEFGVIDPRQLPAEKALLLYSTGGQSFKVDGVTCDIEGVEVSPPTPTDKRNIIFRSTVRAGSGTESGIHRGKISFQFADRNDKGLSVPVHIEVLPQVRLEPSPLFLGILAPNGKAEVSARLIGLTDAEWSACSINTTGQSLLVKREGPGSDGLVCSVTAPETHGEFQSDLIVSLASGVQYTFRAVGVVTGSEK